jgi:hypothetical protein
MAIPPLAIAAITAAVTGATAVAGAVEQNQQADKRDDAARNAADTQTAQLRKQAELEATKRVREARAIRGAILARDSVAGGTLLDQVDADLGLNLGILDQNLDNALARVASGLDADLAGSQRSNPLFAGVTGGLQGASAGIGIASGLTATQAYNQQNQQPQVVFGDPTRIGVFA